MSPQKRYALIRATTLMSYEGDRHRTEESNSPLRMDVERLEGEDSSPPVDAQWDDDEIGSVGALLYHELPHPDGKQLEICFHHEQKKPFRPKSLYLANNFIS